MEAGELRNLLTIQAPVPGQNTYGEDTGANWSTVGTTWGSIEALSGREIALAQANTITATATIKIKVRWQPGFQTTWRLAYSSGDEPTRYFAINAAVDPTGRREELRITCTEVKA